MNAFTLVKVVGTTLCNPDGTVLSLNPDTEPAPTTYHWSHMPAGTNGPFEQVAINGGFAVYNPLGVNGEAVLFAFQESVPNTDGLSAINLQRYAD